MWYSKQLRLVRRARRLTKAQQSQLLRLELEGTIAITLHSVTHTLTIPIERPAGAQIVDTLNQVLRDRRRTLKTEARQLRHDWQESERLHARKRPPSPSQPVDDASH